MLHSLREGIGYAMRTPLVLWSLVLLGGIAGFGFNFQILLPLFARDTLGLKAAAMARCSRLWASARWPGR